MLSLSRTGKPAGALATWKKPVDDGVAKHPASRRSLRRLDRPDRTGQRTATLAGMAAARSCSSAIRRPPGWRRWSRQAGARTLGTALVGDFGDNACRDPAAKNALAQDGGPHRASTRPPSITMT